LPTSVWHVLSRSPAVAQVMLMKGKFQDRTWWYAGKLDVPAGGTPGGSPGGSPGGTLKASASCVGVVGLYDRCSLFDFWLYPLVRNRRGSTTFPKDKKRKSDGETWGRLRTCSIT
jgi:hypothetical protein